MEDNLTFTFGLGETVPEEHLNKDKLGGKGYGLCIMSNDGFPVPPGVVFATDFSKKWMTLEDSAETDLFLEEVVDHVLDVVLPKLEEKLGHVPLLSVRSGAPVSMPGMMDTILNVGLCDDNFDEWAERIGPRAALDSYRRLIQMLGSTAFDIPHDVFEKILAQYREAEGVKTDAELSDTALEDTLHFYKLVFEQHTKIPFPQTLSMQLSAAAAAVFESWGSDRAVTYRKMNNISVEMGTALNVQAMVFGNTGPESGTGVLFTRNPLTGQTGMYGEFLPDAQGEDVVAGIRTPMDVWDMNSEQLQDTSWPTIYNELVKTCAQLEEVYRDMVDIEFTVQEGKLFILQSRVGKRSALAAFQIAVDLYDNEVIKLEEVFQRLTVEQYKMVSKPVIDPSFKDTPALKGIPASPGVAVGRMVFSAAEAVEEAKTGPVILVTHETTPDDIAGMDAAVGIITQTGGATSHAAVVARAMDKPCVVGCTDLELQDKLVGVNGKQIKSEVVTIDGGTGRMWFTDKVPVVDASSHPAVQRVLQLATAGQSWCAPVIDLTTMPMNGTFAFSVFEMVRSASQAEFDKKLLMLRNALSADWDCIVDGRSAKEIMQGNAFELESLFGIPMLLAARYDIVFSELEKHREHVMLIHCDPSSSMQTWAKDLGIKTIRRASNVHEYLTNPSFYADAAFIEMLGSDIAMEAIDKIAPPREVPQVVHTRHALFKRLLDKV